jgi:hypothetical protein
VVELAGWFDVAEQAGCDLAVLLPSQVFGERRPGDRQFHL